jgi:hypothetical protein
VYSVRVPGSTSRGSLVDPPERDSYIQPLGRLVYDV